MQLGSIYSFEDCEEGCDLSSSCIITPELEHSPQREEILGSTLSGVNSHLPLLTQRI